MYINTNVSALFAENSLSNTQNTLNTLQQEMSTGYQINSPSDNPSGMAISNLMSGELGAINNATNNATEASNLLNTANGGMQTDIQIVQQIQQLAVQASNSTNNSQDTQDIQNQIQQLLVGMDNVATTLNYNNQFVLNQGPTATTPTATNDVLTLSSAPTSASAFTNISGLVNNTTALVTVSESFTAGSSSVAGSVTITLNYGGTTVSTSIAAAESSTSAGTGTTVVNLASATLGLNASVTINLATIGSTVSAATAALSLTSPLSSLNIGADSGGLAAGSYTVQAYSNNGTDYVSILDSNGNTVASGSVANLASTTGTVALQLVSGYNSSGSDSFVVDVNQSLLSANTSSTASVSASFTVAAGTSYTFQTGPNEGAGNTLTTQFGAFTSATLGLSNLSVTSSEGAQYAVTQTQSALSMLTNAQSAVGSQIDQINYTLTNLQTESTNLQSSQASIMDANMAQVTSQFAQTQILEQTGIQALTTAQQLPSLVLKLLS